MDLMTLATEWLIEIQLISALTQLISALTQLISALTQLISALALLAKSSSILMPGLPTLNEMLQKFANTLYIGTNLKMLWLVCALLRKNSVLKAECKFFKSA